MKPAVAWTISAVLFLVMFVGARMYVNQKLSETVERERDPRGVHTPVPAPPPAPEPVGDPVYDLDRQLAAAIADPDPSARERVHHALDALTMAELTPAQLADGLKRFAARGDQAHAAGRVDVETHLLAVRVVLAERAGAPALALAEQLAAWEAEDPAAFSWRTPPSAPPGP
jgi:hypothetical protein